MRLLGPKAPRAVIAALAALALVAAACGDDDDTATDAPDETVGDTTDDSDGPDGTTATTADAAGDFCVDGPAVDALLAQDEPDPAAVEEALAAAQASAPEDIADDVQVAADAVQEVFETGDFTIFLRPAVADALVAINETYVDDCGYQRLDLTAREYEFDAPDAAGAGQTSIFLTNEGGEVHEAIVFRIHDDVTETLEELLALPEEEVQTKVTEAGAAFAAPGVTGTGVADLTEPGRYAIVCFVPVGTTAEVLASGEEPQGEPHAMRGMVAELTVE